MRIIGQGRVGPQRTKNEVDRVDHRLAGAVAFQQRSRLAQAGKLPGQFVENFGHAATPAVDRLLDVADAKKRSLPFAPDHNPFGQRRDGLPLGERGVLKLVEQQMGHLAVEAKTIAGG